ncbi:class I SAM-dependent methyltransferase [Azospirillum isscasi]|uniref:Class I SAM-dependent methyltransferase n=1 Tax=Azospirillum isscasi TaxID=3053926 RepID=A0ABU0WKZ7_9PROT|nr:class I SAM-dependent methyltransferase [Azospirillum isscasi]MDQ2104777.1 class I SAM-dependent methyltransferase [Azospirillum isscasi]
MTVARSTLDRMIDRLTAQRVALGWAAGCVAGSPGLVMEIGLGKGRTYDHLRRLFPPRDILVFDMWARVPPPLRPEEDRLFLGDFRETLPAAAERFRGAVRLAHADVGSAREDEEDGIRHWIAGLIDPFLAPGALVLSDRPIGAGRGGWEPLGVPGTESWAYHGWRVG